jgi:hypothetical protein
MVRHDIKSQNKVTMPAPAKHPRVFLALSPSALATAFCIQPRHVYQAIARGELEVRTLEGTMARRILVSDAEIWFRTHWLKANTRKSKNG